MSYYNSDGILSQHKKVLPNNGDEGQSKAFSYSNKALIKAAVNQSKNTPQAMVKVISFSSTKKELNNLLDYISREYEITLKSDDYELDHKDDIRALADDWMIDYEGVEYMRDKNKKSYKERHAMHMQISLPKGYPADKMDRIAKDFGKKEFADRYEYVYALHTDNNRPHAHFIVKTKGFDGTRLNPRKETLAHWRGQTVEIAKSHGIALDATPALVRGVRGVNKKLSHMHLRQKIGLLREDEKLWRNAQSLMKKGQIAKNKHEQFNERRINELKTRYASIGDTLFRQGELEKDDNVRRLGLYMREYGQSLNAPLSKRQELIRAMEITARDKSRTDRAIDVKKRQQDDPKRKR